MNKSNKNKSIIETKSLNLSNKINESESVKLKNENNYNYGDNKICDKSLTFDDCELAILRSSVDLAQSKIGKKIVNSPEIKKIIKILEDFIKDKKLICYGGTALNNILPKEAQFYDRDTEIPDYDMFSKNGMLDAKELADIYYTKGFEEVEAKSGKHAGTYKVFVNFIPIADITTIPEVLFDSINKEALKVDGILYTPPNYLRMSMYLELSRPAGDTTRWEKVLKRLTLFNKYYPLVDEKCKTKNFQRKLEDKETSIKKEKHIYDIVRETFIEEGCVFFGGYALSIYAEYMPKENRDKIATNIPDFDVLSNNPKKTANAVKKELEKNNIKNVSIKEHTNIGDVIPEHIEICVGDDTIAFIYKPIGCHSFNKIDIDNKKIKVATIDTILSFYLAFLYADREYYDTYRLLCMSQFLFDVQQHNRLEQKGVLRRFSITCYGYQETKEDLRAMRAKKYKELKKGSDEYFLYFFSYRPESYNNLSNSNLSPNQQLLKSKLETIDNKNNKNNKNKDKDIKKIKTISIRTKSMSPTSIAKKTKKVRKQVKSSNTDGYGFFNWLK